MALLFHITLRDGIEIGRGERAVDPRARRLLRARLEELDGLALDDLGLLLRELVAGDARFRELEVDEVIEQLLAGGLERRRLRDARRGLRIEPVDATASIRAP